MIKDDEELVYQLGLSKSLHEHSQIEGRVTINKDIEGLTWSIYLHPSIDIYPLQFQVYDNVDIFDAEKIARISMAEPKYIECGDSSKRKWILGEKEKRLIVDDISKHWELIKYIYYDELLGIYSEDELRFILDLPMPDYTKL